MNLDDVLRVALSGITWASLTTVKPLHKTALVPPNTHRQDHTAAQRIAHALHGAQLHERIGAVGSAGSIIKGNVFGLILEDNAILDVLALDGLEHTVLSRELGNHGEGLLGVNFEAKTVEISCTVAVRIFAAAILVAETGSTAISALALEKTGLAACVRCDLSRAAVGFPDVHFVAADAGAINVSLQASVCLVGRESSVTYDTVHPRSNETLGIAVASTDAGTSRIQVRSATVRPHLREIQGAVHATRQLRHIDVEGELLTSQLQHLVVLLALAQEIRPRALKLLVLAIEVHAQACTIGEDTIVLVVTDWLQDAVLRASLLVRAHGQVCPTTPVAATFGRVVLLVNRVDGSIEDNVAVLGFATSLLGTLVGGELGVLLRALAEGLCGGDAQ